MTTEGLISIQAMTARIACRWMTTQQLDAVSQSIDRAALVPARSQWETKAAAHAEIFGLLGDATGYPALAERAGLAAGWVNDVALAVGPAADGMILSSRRRLLRCLRIRDAEGAGREMEHHLRGLHYMGRLAGPSPQDGPDLMRAS
jgi:GntR family transcriptional regulator, transcriptional repressor for pyruvate dehydrogenase complex